MINDFGTTYVFVQLWYLFPEKMKTKKRNSIYTYITEDLFVKKKLGKIISVQSRKVQKMFTMLQGKIMLHFSRAPYKN